MTVHKQEKESATSECHDHVPKKKLSFLYLR